jgi:DNA helicase-2/ATP-dependent DNA helicase PcrA
MSDVGDSAEAVPPLRRGGQKVSEEQAAVVDHVLTHPVTVSDAGAGAGKTQTTVAAVFELLAQRPDAAIGQFVLITFTNKAADELKRRLAKALEELRAAATTPEDRRRWGSAQERLGDAYVGTIHGFCRLILRTFGYGALVARLSDMDFAGGMLYESIEEAVEEEVLSTPDHPLLVTLRGEWRLFELQRLIRDIYQDLRNCGFDPTKVAEATARQRYGSEDSGRAFRTALAAIVADAHRRYTEKKEEAQKLDSTDLLLRTADVLSGPHGAVIIRKLTSRFRYLFVDEFQDTDPTQERLVSLLEPQLAAVLLVGDGKQSIYRFRGAGLSLEQLALRKSGRPPLRLSISRRPTDQLLEAYNALFDAMSKPAAAFPGARRYPELGQPLKPHEGTLKARNRLPPIALLDAGGRDDRGARIARTAKAVRGLLSGKKLDTPDGQRDLEPGDIAILFRVREALADYERGLREALQPDGIEVRTEAGGRFYTRPEVVGTYRLLRFLLEYPNDVVTMQALLTPYLAGAGLPDIERSILWYGRRRGQELTNEFEARNAELAEKFRRLRSALRTDTVPELLGRMDELLGLREHHRHRGDAAGEEGLERLRELARSLTRSEQALTAGAFARHLARGIWDDAEGPEIAPMDDRPDRRPPYVRLMTVHAAKGLEFPVVIIPEVQAPIGNRGSSRFLADEREGLDVRIPELQDVLETESPAFWGRANIDRTAAIFEEMRVFYVAVTRAQNHVVLVGADTSTTFAPGEKPYSWQDEILAAWAALTPHGVAFGRPPA